MPAVTTRPTPLRAVLFDLGRVVIDIDFDRALAAWQKHSRLPLHELRTLYQADEPYRQHETGALSDDGYFRYLRERLQLDCGIEDVARGWNALLVAGIDETLQMIDAIRGQIPCYAISNTNGCHVQEMHRAFPDLLPRFRKVFASHEIGYRKPDARAFLHVCREVGVAPAKALLFDDLPVNIEGARACGLQAALVKVPEDVRVELVRQALL